jgi:hypothetical protein
LEPEKIDFRLFALTVRPKMFGEMAQKYFNNHPIVGKRCRENNLPRICSSFIKKNKEKSIPF